MTRMRTKGQNLSLHAGKMSYDVRVSSYIRDVNIDYR